VTVLSMQGIQAMPQGHYFQDDDDLADEAWEPPTRRSQAISRPMPSVIDTRGVSVVRRRDPEGPPERRRFSRRDLLTWGGAALAAAAGLGILSQTKPAKQALAALGSGSGKGATSAPTPVPTAASAAPKLPFGYFHACFEINSEVDAAAAAKLGINYTIAYANASWNSADPTTSIGQTLLHYGMKTFVNLEYPYLVCSDSYGHVTNLEQVRNLVTQFKDSPLTAGYWIKDDDCTYTGDEQVALVGIYNLIREIDPNPTHLIMPGFGDAGSVYRNYAHGCGDLLGFYPYPAYSRGPALEVPDMLQTVRERTPPGAQPPPFMGVYQVFATPPIRPAPSESDILGQVQAYMANGAAGIAGFGWHAPNESLIIANYPPFYQAVGAVTQWLEQHGYGSPPSP
jgi:hypothetical protein